MARPVGYRDYLNNLLETNRRLKRVYIKATDSLIDTIGNFTVIDGRQGATKFNDSDSKEYNETLTASSLEVRREADSVIRESLSKSVETVKKPQDAFLLSLLAAASAVFLPENVERINKQVTDYVTDIQFKKVYRFADGSVGAYSKSVWGVYSDYKTNLDNVVSEGFRRGRSSIDIARDLEVYVNDGKKALMNRYLDLLAPQKQNETLEDFEKRIEAALLPGETIEQAKDRVSRFSKRIGSNIDYRAVRLARTMFQGAVQDALIAAAETNPAVYAFDWVLSPAHIEYSVCEDIVASNPWTYNTFDWSNPPHVNCKSHPETRQMNRETFLKSLESYIENPNDPQASHIKEWAGAYYEPLVNGATIELPRLLENNLRRAAA